VGQYSAPGTVASIAVLDRTTLTLITTIDLPNFSHSTYPKLALNTTTNTIYATTNYTGNGENTGVEVINGNSNQVVALVSVASGPSATAVNESTGRVYTNSSTSGVVSSFGNFSCGTPQTTRPAGTSAVMRKRAASTYPPRKLVTGLRRHNQVGSR
jgi:hypothetical protein